MQWVGRRQDMDSWQLQHHGLAKGNPAAQSAAGLVENEVKVAAKHARAWTRKDIFVDYPQWLRHRTAKARHSLGSLTERKFIGIHQPALVIPDVKTQHLSCRRGPTEFDLNF